MEADSRSLSQDTVAGNTALHLAAADGHLEVVKVLAKALSPDELGALNDRGINALMVTRTNIPEIRARMISGIFVCPDTGRRVRRASSRRAVPTDAGRAGSGGAHGPGRALGAAPCVDRGEVRHRRRVHAGARNQTNQRVFIQI